MISVDEAIAAIQQHVSPLATASVPLGDAQGLVLAEAIVSTIDSPPFDKALMDGFAVRAADVAEGRAVLRLVDEVTAGHVADKAVGPGEAIQIMTGAPMPDGADAVVRIEDTQAPSDSDGQSRVTIETNPVTVGQDLARQGMSMRKGQQVLPAGRLLRPQELGLLAELGRHLVPVRTAPTVGVLATGDELVGIDQVPGPGQIRNSNQTMLAAQVRACGAEAVELGIARDTPEHLAEKIAEGLDCDVLLLSGGVSAGRLDLVPAALQAAGIGEVFHKVKVKPGKPLWFGTAANTAANTAAGCCVFGLPGNPVSSMVCFELFVRTALRRLAGQTPSRPTGTPARLVTAHQFRGDRPTYFPARYDSGGDGPRVTPVDWRGSSDLRSTAEANAMILFPAGDHEYAAGETVEVLHWAGAG